MTIYNIKEKQPKHGDKIIAHNGNKENLWIEFWDESEPVGNTTQWAYLTDLEYACCWVDSRLYLPVWEYKFYLPT